MKQKGGGFQMTTDGLKVYSIKYLVEYIEKNQKNGRINILTAAGIIEGKITIVHEDSKGAFPEFINGMLSYYEQDYDIDDPFIGDQKNTFITIENAIIKNNASETKLKNLIVYLDEIIGFAMCEKDNV